MIETGLNRLIRNIKLKDYFNTKDTPNAPFNYLTRRFPYPSKWTPPTDKLPSNTLSTIISLTDITDTILDNQDPDQDKNYITKQEPNLTRPEYSALRTLSKDNNIIIKPADKGGGAS